MAETSNNNSKFKLTTNVSFLGHSIVIIFFTSALLFVYYVQFFADVNQMSIRAKSILYSVFGRTYSLTATMLFLMINFLVAKLFISIIPRAYQIVKYKNGFIFYDMKSLYFGNEILPLQDVYKCNNDVSTEFKNPRHKFWIHNLSGKSYWCHYVFEEDPKQLAAQIEKLAHEARLAT